MTQDSTRSVSKSALLFLSGTSLSRVSGLVREMAMAFCFGVAPAIAAFMVAFRFANLIRRLFGEGSAPAGFTPHFEHLRASSPLAGAQFFRDLLGSLTAFLLGLIVLIEGVLFVFLKWGGLSPGNLQILYLTMLMLPGVLFICLYAINSALLQCEKNFFLTGAAPLAFNLIWIAAAFWLKDTPPVFAAAGLSCGIVLAFVAQWMMTAPAAFAYLRRFLNFKQLFQVHLFSPEVKQIIRPFLLGIIGVGAVQINSALDSLFARYASLEGPAYLWYAIRIQQLPLALFGIALSSALLPPLSRAMKAGQKEEYRSLLHFGLKRSFSLMFPCTVAIFILGAVGINAVYGRGQFSEEATFQTTICLWAYGLGLVPAVFVLLLAPAFYAQKNYRIPTLASLLSVGLNTVLNALMVFVMGWGAVSIAIATSLCAVFNCAFLMNALAKQMGIFFNKETLLSFAKTMSCSCIAGAAVLALGDFVFHDPTIPMVLGRWPIAFSHHFLGQAVSFTAQAVCFLSSFLLCAKLFRAQDILELIGKKRQSEWAALESNKENL